MRYDKTTTINEIVEFEQVIGYTVDGLTDLGGERDYDVTPYQHRIAEYIAKPAGPTAPGVFQIYHTGYFRQVRPQEIVMNMDHAREIMYGKAIKDAQENQHRFHTELVNNMRQPEQYEARAD